MKGIILAGGTATRLFPTTLGCCKQLLPVYDKPMIYYPLSTLIDCGCTDVLLICKEYDKCDFENLLGDGSRFGIKITYKIQDKPRGLADAYNVAGDWLNNERSILILGDNIFASKVTYPSTDVIFDDYITRSFLGWVIKVKDPERYGVAVVDEDGFIQDIEEKPKKPKSDYAVVGLYSFPAGTQELVKQLKPSSRGELEIVDLIKLVIKKKTGRINKMKNSDVWLDAGIVSALAEATEYVKAVQNRSGMLIGSPEIAAYRKELITFEQLKQTAETLFKNSDYGANLIHTAQCSNH